MWILSRFLQSQNSPRFWFLVEFGKQTLHLPKEGKESEVFMMSMRIVRLSKIVPHTFTHQSTHARMKPSTSNSLKKLTFSQDWEASISYRLEKKLHRISPKPILSRISFRGIKNEPLLERQKLSSEIKLRIESAWVSTGVYRKRIVSKITFFFFEIMDA